MAKFNESDPTEFQADDFIAALEDIAEADPDLIPYIITCYPPELMMHISPELCQRLEQLEKSSSHQEITDS